MTVREIEARTLLQPVRQPDAWFGIKYNMNLYRGANIAVSIAIRAASAMKTAYTVFLAELIVKRGTCRRINCVPGSGARAISAWFDLSGQAPRFRCYQNIMDGVRPATAWQVMT